MALFHTNVLDPQIKALPTTDTASGSIATFDTDMTENLVEVKCQIVAKQASGTPTPDNPLPITTFSEMNVSHSGKNLCNTAIFNSATIFTVNGDGSVTQNSNDTRSESAMVTLFLKAGQYTFSRGVAVGTMSIYYNDNGNWQYLVRNSNSEKVTFNLTVDTNLYIKMSVNGSYPTTFSPQMEKGETKTTFVAYNGTTETISFDQTVANGVINVTTGKLVINKNKVTVGSSGWNKFGNFFFMTFSDKQRTTTADEYPLVCSMLENGGTVSASGQMSDTHIYQFSTNDNIYIYDSSCANEAAFYNKYSACEILYQLATPIEIQLDSTQITALLNENNIWCDTGDTEVKYLLTVGKKIS